MTQSPHTAGRTESPVLAQQQAHYAGEARGVQTNGEGDRTTAHLNLTRTLADVKEPRNRFADAKTMQRAEKRARRLRERQSDYKIKYAGAEA